jgi:hypothetical protein
VKEVLGQFENHLKIPMSANIRSFNIANSVALSLESQKTDCGKSILIDKFLLNLELRNHKLPFLTIKDNMFILE